MNSWRVDFESGVRGWMAVRRWWRAGWWEEGWCRRMEARMMNVYAVWAKASVREVERRDSRSLRMDISRIEDSVVWSVDRDWW